MEKEIRLENLKKAWTQNGKNSRIRYSYQQRQHISKLLINLGNANLISKTALCNLLGIVDVRTYENRLIKCFWKDKEMDILRELFLIKEV